MLVFRNLDKVRFFIREATGLDVMYAAEDLVFPEHGAFLIQFDDSNEDNFFCYFHEDCLPVQKQDIYQKFSNVCKLNKCTVENKGRFTMEQRGEEIDIKFN